MSQFASKGISLAEEFVKVYKKINEKCWERYRSNQLSKENLRFERFKETLEYFGIYNLELSIKMGNDYVKLTIYEQFLIPNTIELLTELQHNYQLHIITNGFQEVQHIKIDQSGLSKFFKIVVTSEMAGAKKPSPLIFNYALEKSGATVQNSVMIGDDLNTDIQGALKVGMKAIYFNPDKKSNNTKCVERSFQLNKYKYSSINRLFFYLRFFFFNIDQTIFVTSLKFSKFVT